MKCEYCSSRPGTWYAYDRDGKRHFACRRHRQRLKNFCVTIIFPMAQVRQIGGES